MVRMSDGQVRRVASLPVNHNSGAQSGFHGNRERSITDSKIVTPRYPEPFMSIPAQSLVRDDCRVHCGMVRKENKYKQWQDRYLVLHKGCLYYFKDSRDKSAKGQFSLSGYRVSSAPERSKFQWVFKLSHIQPEKRTYYFAAHSEKEMNDWFEKIKEDITDYCEPLGTASGFNPTIRESSSESSSSSDDNDGFKYDYPLVTPPDLNVMKAKMAEMRLGRSPTSPPASVSTEAEYCPPPAFDWTVGMRTGPLGGPPDPPPREHARQQSQASKKVQGKVPTPLVVMKAGKQSINVSDILPKRVSPETIEEESTPRPSPLPRVRGAGGPTVPKKPSRSRPTSPPVRPDKPLKKFASDSALLSHGVKRGSQPSSLSEDDEDSQEYLEIIQDDLPCSPTVTQPTVTQTSPSNPRQSTLERVRPEGRSFHGNQGESPRKCQDVLPPSAQRLDIDKTVAIPMLEGNDGMYILHKSSKGDINQCLSVYIEGKVRHFLIFKNEDGYALHPDSHRCPSIEELIWYHYTKPLPRQLTATLVEPYH